MSTLTYFMLKIIYTCKMSRYGGILIMYISSVSMRLPESMKCPNSGRPLFFFPFWLLHG